MAPTIRTSDGLRTAGRWTWFVPILLATLA